jgi:KEOPS complex subunit Cgi121
MRAEEYGRSIEALGFRLLVPAQPKELVEQTRAIAYPALIQLFDARNIAGPEHLLFATVNALNAFMKGRNIAQSLDVEILLYVSAQRQISKAIKMVGLTSETLEVAAVVVAEEDEALNAAVRRLNGGIAWRREDSVLYPVGEKRKRLMEMYGVTELELKTLSEANSMDALPWLIVERCALLRLRR